MSLFRAFRSYGSLRKCLFSFIVVPLCILMLVTTLSDFYLNGLNLNDHNHKHLPFHQSFKSPFEFNNEEKFSVESNFTKMLEVIHLARKISIDKNCRDKTLQQHLLKPYRKAARFYADKSHQLLYCYIPKVACTNLKRFMLLLSGTVDPANFTSVSRKMVHSSNPMRNIQPQNEEELVRRGVGGYKKFLFVRHPFERLVSAYYSKFARGNRTDNDPDPINRDTTEYPQYLGTSIIEKYRKNATALSLKKGHDVTIPEFVSYVIDEWKAKKEMDVHWKPQVELCLPCSMKYDFVGKFETMQQDIGYLLHKLKENKFSQYFKKTTPHSTSALTKQFMDQLSPEQFAGISQVYKEDFKVFGYEPNINNITV